MGELETVIVALGQMAAFRGADVTAQTQTLYAKRLLAEGCKAADVVEACRRLELRERKEGEMAFPALATLLREIQGIVTARRERARELEQRECDRLATARCLAMSPEEREARSARFREMFREAVSRR